MVINILNKFTEQKKTNKHKNLTLTNIFLLNSIKLIVRHVKIFTLGLIGKVKGVYFIKLVEVNKLVIVLIFIIKSFSKN